MKRVILLRLLTGTLALSLAVSLTACEENQVKPTEKKMLTGGEANDGGGKGH